MVSMNKILLLLIAVFAIQYNALSQENTFSKDEKEKLINDSIWKKSSVLIIPFEEKMYMSEIDHRITTKSKMTYEELNHFMRKSLTEEVANAVSLRRNAYSFYHPEIDSIKKELHFISTSVSYQYLQLPKEESIQNDPSKEDNSQKKELENLNPFKKTAAEKQKKAADQRNSGIVNGQLATTEKQGERYMHCRIDNPELLAELKGFHLSQWFVFINQLDLLYSSDHPGMVRIKVHYTLYSEDNKLLHSGAEVVLMPENVTDIKEIRDIYLKRAAIGMSQKIATFIPSE